MNTKIFKKLLLISISAFMLISIAGDDFNVLAEGNKKVQAVLQMPKSLEPGNAADVIVKIRVDNLSVAKFSLTSTNPSVLEITSGGGELMVEGEGTISVKAKIKAIKPGKASIVVRNDVVDGVSQSIDMITLERIDFAASVPVTIAKKEQEVKPDTPIEVDKNPSNPKPKPPVSENPDPKEPAVDNNILNNPYLTEVDILDENKNIITTISINKEEINYSVVVPGTSRNIHVVPKISNPAISLIDYAEAVSISGNKTQKEIVTVYKGSEKKYFINISLDEFPPIVKNYRGFDYKINGNNIIADNSSENNGPGYIKISPTINIQMLEDDLGDNYWFIINENGELIEKIQPIMKDDKLFFILNITSEHKLKKGAYMSFDYTFDYSIIGDSVTAPSMGKVVDKYIVENENYVIAIAFDESIDSYKLYKFDEENGVIHDSELQLDENKNVINEIYNFIKNLNMNLIYVAGAFIVGLFIAGLFFSIKIRKIKKEAGVDNRVIVGISDEEDIIKTPILDNPVSSDDDIDEIYNQLIKNNKLPNHDVDSHDNNLSDTEIIESISEIISSDDYVPETLDEPLKIIKNEVVFEDEEVEANYKTINEVDSSSITEILTNNPSKTKGELFAIDTSKRGDIVDE